MIFLQSSKLQSIGIKNTHFLFIAKWEFHGQLPQPL